MRGLQPYSQELRDRMMQALPAGRTAQSAIAARCCVSLAFVVQLWQRWRGSGSRAAPPHAGGRRRALTDPSALLRREVAHPPAVTLAAWRERLAAAPGPHVSTATLGRA